MYINNNEESKLCSMCNETRDGGTNILGSYICKRCEDDMIREDITEMRMQHYKDRIKMMWKNYKPS